MQRTPYTGCNHRGLVFSRDKALTKKLALYAMEAPNGVANMTKIVAGKQLWNYDNLEPTEKKLVL